MATEDSPLERLLAGEIGLEALPQSIFDAYCLGYADGRAARQPELDGANDEADRLYVLAMAGPPQVPRDLRTLAEIERERGNGARADALDAESRRRFWGAA
jgi:hypothetical protein